jgi:predicted nucleic acid-binding protein
VACSINLGEVFHRQVRAAGWSVAGECIDALRRDIEVVNPDWELVEAAASIKVSGGLSFADAFCIATASRVGAVLWTGDPEIIDHSGNLLFEVLDLR